ncbi:Oxysterol-binding protein-related protein 10 [Fukomys damarensis]|uniref:Oxysterol-binding protein-related protein 10 n=1 Tax=Fukomys damarensis TaxID=885580 RepID=A0A091DWU7_FUKDA|nr:Oxysterol-binding protein-related protein 10 [Fukomys damarensis]
MSSDCRSTPSSLADGASCSDFSWHLRYYSKAGGPLAAATWGYFVLDFEAGILQYFVNEQSKHQKPRGALCLSGAIVSLSDEAPHMLVVYSASGEMYKLRAADAREKQFWVTQLRACAKYHMETNSKSTPSSRSRSLTLLPHGTPNSASPCSQRHLIAGAPGVVTITHHKSPAAARRAKSQYPGQLHEVREMMSQVEGQQKNLVHAIESLPGSGPLTALDQDLLLLKATSAATLSCLGECLSLLQQSVHQGAAPSHKPGPSENILGWHGSKSHSTEQLKNGTLSSLPSASANITWAILPNSTEDEQTLQPEPEVNCNLPNEEPPNFIEMGAILTSNGRKCNRPIKMMLIDLMGAVTIYYVAPLNNGFFVWFVLMKAPASHARLLHATESARVRGAVAKTLRGNCTVAQLRLLVVTAPTRRGGVAPAVLDHWLGPRRPRGLCHLLPQLRSPSSAS